MKTTIVIRCDWCTVSSTYCCYRSTCKYCEECLLSFSPCLCCSLFEAQPRTTSKPFHSLSRSYWIFPAKSHRLFHSRLPKNNLMHTNELLGARARFKNKTSDTTQHYIVSRLSHFRPKPWKQRGIPTIHVHREGVAMPLRNFAESLNIVITYNVT